MRLRWKEFIDNAWRDVEADMPQLEGHPHILLHTDGKSHWIEYQDEKWRCTPRCNGSMTLMGEKVETGAYDGKGLW